LPYFRQNSTGIRPVCHFATQFRGNPPIFGEFAGFPAKLREIRPICHSIFQHNSAAILQFLAKLQDFRQKLHEIRPICDWSLFFNTIYPRKSANFSQVCRISGIIPRNPPNLSFFNSQFRGNPTLLANFSCFLRNSAEIPNFWQICRISGKIPEIRAICRFSTQFRGNPQT